MSVHRRHRSLALAACALAGAGALAPSSASAQVSQTQGFIVAREHRVSGGQLDLRIRLTPAGRRALGTRVPVVIVRMRASQLRNVTGRYRTPVRFLRLGDRMELVRARRSGSRIRLSQLRARANASRPTFSAIDRADVQEVQRIDAAERRAAAARTRGEPNERIVTLKALQRVLYDSASRIVERAERQELFIARSRASLPSGGGRAAAAAELERRMARPIAESRARREVARRLRARADALDAEILTVGAGGDEVSTQPSPGGTFAPIFSELSSFVPAINAALADLANRSGRV